MTQEFTPGLKSFLLIWFGQLVSLLGTGLTNFALGVWVFQNTGSVGAFGMVLLCASLPGIVASPFAGALVDRYSRRTALIVSDAVAGSASLCIALLLFSGHLAVWHICLIVAVSSAVTSLQMPALIAATTLLVPKDHLGRASGLMQVAQAASLVISPGLAGILILVFKLGGILVVDAATYGFAVLTLALVRIPFPPHSKVAQCKTSLLSDVVLGWKYIIPRPGLLDLLMVLAITNLIAGYTNVLLTPLVLSFTSPRILGLALSAGGVGFLIGSIGLSAWGGPKRRINGVLGLGLLQGGCVLLAGLRPSAFLVATASFAVMFLLPMINGCNQVLWQTKTAPELQGRVFALRRAVASAMVPLAYLTAGPLVQHVFSRLLATERPYSSTLHAIVGTGPGRSIGLMFIAMGILYIVTMLLAYTRPHLRNVECELPDCIPASLESTSQTTEAFAVDNHNHTAAVAEF